MRYNQPLGIPDTDAPYIDGNPPAGIRGSIIPAPAVEHPQREIVYAIEDAGLTPNPEDLTGACAGNTAFHFHLRG